MNQPITLQKAKNNLDRAVRLVASYMLNAVDPASRGINGSVTAKRFCDVSSACNELYYFHSNVSNGATFGKRVQDARASRLSLLDDADFNRLVELAYAAYSVAEELAKAEKARLTDKRAARTAKADLNARLNLQPGVSLKGVDVGQYEVILAGLEPVRTHVELRHTDALIELKNEYAETLAAHNWNPELVKAWRVGNPEAYNYFKAPTHFNAFFKAGSRSGGRYGSPADNVCEKPRDEVEAYINKVAKLFALAYVQGYAAKLAVKTGEVIANDFAGFAPVLCWVTSNDLWRNSVAYIKLHDASKAEVVLTFHTQIIWNRSCLGKVFNQYPTRRV